MAVDWSYYDNKKFTDIEERYLPAFGQGETMATQIVTAVTKLVYKWYNDGDVYDNQHGMAGWCNDLSSYANWLYSHVDGVECLMDIAHCCNSDDYEEILKTLVDITHDEEFLSDYVDRPALGDIYSCDGPFEFCEDEDDEDEYWDEYDEEDDEDEEDWED